MDLKPRLDIGLLTTWEKTYDLAHEDIALCARGEFIQAFPLKNLGKIRLDDYVIGLKRPTFCTFVEAKTRPWANIQGATSNKFGIYFGKTKSDSKKTYRFTLKFGQDRNSAFRSVKTALLDLIQLGGAAKLDFDAIDANPLSQMFKAKILSLYFPDRFLNVCSREHLEMLGVELGCGSGCRDSEYQHLLLRAKQANSVTNKWSNPKFMTFLYQQYVREFKEPTIGVQPPREKTHRKVNFEEIIDQRNRIGKAAEEFALEWEKQRLRGADLENLISKIKDRRDRPGYGYDFLSHTSPKQQRYIEVKSVGRLSGGEGYRFFLSDNEHKVSISAAHRGGYYFYLVFFDKDGTPVDLKPFLANELYRNGEMSPAAYVLRFDFPD